MQDARYRMQVKKIKSMKSPSPPFTKEDLALYILQKHYLKPLFGKEGEGEIL